jgi:hypothetical protein
MLETSEFKIGLANDESLAGRSREGKVLEFFEFLLKMF